MTFLLAIIGMWHFQRVPPTPQPKILAVAKMIKVRDADKEALKRAEKMKLEQQKALEALMKDPEEGELCI